MKIKLVYISLLIITILTSGLKAQLLSDSFKDRDLFTFDLPKLVIPDSLGGEKIDGLLALNIEIDSSGNVLNSKVMKFSLKNEGKIIYSYSINDNYSLSGMQKYELFIESVISKIKIEPNPKYSTRKKNKYSFGIPVRSDE